MEGVQQQLQRALVGGRQLGNDQVGEGRLLAAMLDKQRQQPAALSIVFGCPGAISVYPVGRYCRETVGVDAPVRGA